MGAHLVLSEPSQFQSVDINAYTHMQNVVSAMCTYVCRTTRGVLRISNIALHKPSVVKISMHDASTLLLRVEKLPLL